MVATPVESVTALDCTSPSAKPAVAETVTPGRSVPVAVWTYTSAQMGSGASTMGGTACTDITSAGGTAVGVEVGNGATVGVRVAVGVAVLTGFSIGVAEGLVAAGDAIWKNPDTGMLNTGVEIMALTFTRVPCSVPDGCSTTEVNPDVSVGFM